MNSNRFITALFALFTLFVIGCGDSPEEARIKLEKEQKAKIAALTNQIPAPDPKASLDRIMGSANTRVEETLKNLGEMKTKNEDIILEYRLQNKEIDDIVLDLRSLKEAVAAEQKAFDDYAAAVQEATNQVAKEAGSTKTQTSGSYSIYFIIIIIILLLVIIAVFIKWIFFSSSDDNFDDDDEFDFDDEFFDDEEDDEFLEDDSKDKSKKKSDAQD